MRWYHDIAYVFGGAFLVNAIPHFVTGITGHPFQSPPGILVEVDGEFIAGRPGSGAWA
jgi:hypothetical protein